MRLLSPVKMAVLERKTGVAVGTGAEKGSERGMECAERGAKDKETM